MDEKGKKRNKDRKKPQKAPKPVRHNEVRSNF